MKKVGIIGGSGYTGGELIRLVLHHPKLELDFVYSTTRPRTPIRHTQRFAGEPSTRFYSNDQSKCRCRISMFGTWQIGWIFGKK